MFHCCVIYNPAAGNGKAKGVLEHWLTTVAPKKYTSDKLLVVATERPQHALHLAVKAYKEGYREFVCIGGDGTFHEMCQPLVGKNDVRVALVPAGSGNDLVRVLGFSQDFNPNEWEDFIKDDAVAMDVGICNDEFFFNTMGIGFDALVASDFDNKHNHAFWIKLLPQHIQYYPFLFKRLLFYKGTNLSVNGTPTSVFLLSIGNGRFSGGGVPLTPHALAGDGFLDLCIIENVGIAKRCANLLLALRGKHGSLPFVHTSRFQKLTITANQPECTHIDGEIVLLDHWNISIQPASLWVYAQKSRATLL